MKAMTVGELSEWLASNKVDPDMPLAVRTVERDADGVAVPMTVNIVEANLEGGAHSTYTGAVRLEVEL